MSKTGRVVALVTLPLPFPPLSSPPEHLFRNKFAFKANVKGKLLIRKQVRTAVKKQ